MKPQCVNCICKQHYRNLPVKSMHGYWTVTRVQRKELSSTTLGGRMGVRLYSHLYCRWFMFFNCIYIVMYIGVQNYFHIKHGAVVR